MAKKEEATWELRTTTLEGTLELQPKPKTQLQSMKKYTGYGRITHTTDTDALSKDSLQVNCRSARACIVCARACIVCARA